MFCPYCGADHGDRQRKFCPTCGKQMEMIEFEKPAAVHGVRSVRPPQVQPQAAKSVSTGADRRSGITTVKGVRITNQKPAPQKPAAKPGPKRPSGKTVMVGVAVLLAIVLLGGAAFLIKGAWDKLAQMDWITENKPGTSEHTSPNQQTEGTASSGTVLMPNYVGLYYNDALQTVTGENFTPWVEYAYSDSIAEGYIISQSVPEGTVLSAGDTIVLVVSKGPEFAPEGYSQKVVVTAPAGSSYGTLTFYEWSDGQWNARFSCEAAVGRNGIGADYGEGRKKTPQGVFKLGIALSADGIPNSAWPYQRVTLDTCVVDDVNSAYYNTIQSISGLPRGVSYDGIGSTLIEGESSVCMFIEHNGNGLTSDGVVAGKGSVITLCGRTCSLQPTLGCVDISAVDMNTLLTWLDHAKQPHIEIMTQ